MMNSYQRRSVAFFIAQSQPADPTRNKSKKVSVTWRILQCLVSMNELSGMMLHRRKRQEEELVDKAKQFTWRLLAASVCLLTVSQVARADSLDEQRNRYAQIKQAWDNRQMDVVEQMMPGLKNYPLYPYLEYRQITDDLMNQPTITVTNFVRANPTLPPARTLKTGVDCWRLARKNRVPRKRNVTITSRNGVPGKPKKPGRARKSCG